MGGLLELLLGEVGLLILSCARLSGMLLLAPLGWDVAPARMRGVLVLILGLSVHSMHPRSLPLESMGVFSWLLIGLGEFILGAAMGFVVRIVISIAEIAAESFSPIMGLGAAQIFDPHTSSTATVLAKMFKYLAIFLALVVGIHRVVLSALLQSFQAIPIGTMDNPGGAAEPLLALVSDAIASGVRIAIPILALLFMTQAALAFISRAAPAMQIFSVGFAVTLAVGAVATILTIPDIGRELLVQLTYVGRHIEQVAASMLSAR